MDVLCLCFMLEPIALYSDPKITLIERDADTWLTSTTNSISNAGTLSSLFLLFLDPLFVGPFFNVLIVVTPRLFSPRGSQDAEN